MIHERADGPGEMSAPLDRLEALLDAEGIDGWLAADGMG